MEGMQLAVLKVDDADGASDMRAWGQTLIIATGQSGPSFLQS